MTENRSFAREFAFTFYLIHKALVVNKKKKKFFSCCAEKNHPKVHSRFPLVVECQGVTTNGGLFPKCLVGRNLCGPCDDDQKEDGERQADCY